MRKFLHIRMCLFGNFTIFAVKKICMQIDRKTGLVLEGGGMRGVFTCGVLDAFMKHDLYFNYVVAVSAGACNGMSYISRQPRRARLSNIDILAKYDYIGLKHLLRQGCIFDPDLIYDRLPNELIPFDWETYFKNSHTFEMVTTNCRTGMAEYLSEHKDKDRCMSIVRASSSLPYVSKIVEVDGVPMLDGGIVDSIPLMRAIKMGYKKNVVILTRNKGYGCESWTVKKAECLRIDAFELWCWRRLLRVPWTARRSNQSILKEISPGCSLEGLMLKLKLQYFGYLMR